MVKPKRPSATSIREKTWLRQKDHFHGCGKLLFTWVFYVSWCFLPKAPCSTGVPVFLKENRGVSIEWAGIGYAAFSIAMAIMRLVGDKIVSRLDGKKVVVYGSLLAASGLFLAVFTPWLATALAGFILLGIGAANIVPIFFSEGGRIKGIPAGIAIPAITTYGYAGQLAGPAALGYIANQFSLPVAIGFTGVLLLFVALSYLLKA